MQRTTMRRYKQYVALAETLLSTRDGSHGVEHAIAVATWVTKLSPEDWALQEVAVVSALMHDAVDQKYVDTPEHTFSDMVQPALSGAGLGDSDIAMVKTVVLNLSFSRDLERGARPPVIEHDPNLVAVYSVVADADRLEALGATGWLRTFMYQGYRGLSFQGARQHVNGKLKRTLETLTNPVAKEIAQRRMANLLKVEEMLQAETDELYHQEAGDESYAFEHDVDCDSFGPAGGRGLVVA